MDSDSDYFMETGEGDDKDTKRNEKLRSKTPETVMPGRDEDILDSNLQDITSQLMAEGASLPLGRRNIKLAPTFDVLSKSSVESDVEGSIEESSEQTEEKVKGEQK